MGRRAMGATTRKVPRQDGHARGQAGWACARAGGMGMREGRRDSRAAAAGVEADAVMAMDRGDSDDREPDKLNSMVTRMTR